MIGNGALTLTKTLNRERVPTAKEPKGFSLMELLVVIVIIGVIAAIGIPQLLGMRTRSSVRADARDIHSAYRQAQTEAVKRFFDVCVDVDAVTSTYQIQIADYFGTGYTASTPIVDGESTVLQEKELRPGNSVNVTNLVCFNTRGLPVKGVGTIGTIEIRNPSLTMEVTLSPSGHVKSTNQ